MAQPRAILHLDLDAFYASVEQLDEPSLRGRPVIVGGTARRGVVCAASYEARKFGVRSAIPTAQARKLCPEGVFLPPRFDRYGQLSDQVFGIYHRFTPLVEPLSLDEAFLDVTASRALHGSGREIATTIKRQVREETGLTVSAGVAEVKFAAKIASDLGKPDGLVEVPAGQVASFLAPLPVGRLWGVGKVTERGMTELGISTIGQLAATPESALVAAFGSHGRSMSALAHGDDPREVIPDWEAKSVGCEDTFDQDVRGEEALLPHLLDQSGRVARRLRQAGHRGRVVTLKLKYSDFTLVTRRRTLAAPTDDGKAIFEVAREQLQRAELARPVRLCGISVSGFEGQEEARQLGLFEAPAPEEDPKRKALNAALDRIAGRFGDRAVVPADLAGKKRRGE